MWRAAYSDWRQTIIIHRREEKYSRARADEIAEAENEGVEFRFATNLVKLEGENGNCAGQ